MSDIRSFRELRIPRNSITVRSSQDETLRYIHQLEARLDAIRAVVEDGAALMYHTHAGAPTYGSQPYEAVLVDQLRPLLLEDPRLRIRHHPITPDTESLFPRAEIQIHVTLRGRTHQLRHTATLVSGTDTDRRIIARILRDSAEQFNIHLKNVTTT